MKPWRYLICLIIGHNKILESNKNRKFTMYFSKCSQCEKKWLPKKLNESSKIIFKKYPSPTTHNHSYFLFIEI